MLKLKLALDTSNRHHMTALSNFAAELAVVRIKQEKEDAVFTTKSGDTVLLAASGRTLENQAHEEANGNTEPLQTPEKPKKPRAEKPKAETEAVEEKPNKAPAAEKQVAEKAPAERVEEAKPAASKITLDDVRRAVAEKKDQHFEIMKFKLKEEFGVSKTPDLKPEDYERFYNFVNSL